MSQDDYLKALEIQRKNFEAQFGSLESLGYEDKTKKPLEASSSSSSENEGALAQDDFYGFSSDDEENKDDNTSDSSSFDSNESAVLDDEEEQAPIVVKLSGEHVGKPSLSNKDKKLLKSGRVPTLAEVQRKELAFREQIKKQGRPDNADDEENLENDLKLQRLLEESHILSNKLKYSGVDTTLHTLDLEDPVGIARRRTLNSRLRNISATNSATAGHPKRLEKMPMAMRKGMIENRKKKISRFEEEARNAGIILSKVKKGQLRDLDSGKGSTPASDRLGTGIKATKKYRQKGLKINTIGRSTANGLILSQKDIEKINGPRKLSKRR